MIAHVRSAGFEHHLEAGHPTSLAVEAREDGSMDAAGGLAYNVIQAAADPALRPAFGKRGCKKVAAHSIHQAGAAYARALRELADGAHDR